MPVFQVSLNGKKISTAGVGELGVLGTHVSWVRRSRELNPETKRGLAKEALHLHVGGLITPTEEHIRWVDRKLKVGDEVRIRIVKEAPVDRPRSLQRPDRAADLRAQKRYVREMAKRFGWTIKTR